MDEKDNLESSRNKLVPRKKRGKCAILGSNYDKVSQDEEKSPVAESSTTTCQEVDQIILNNGIRNVHLKDIWSNKTVLQLYNENNECEENKIKTTN